MLAQQDDASTFVGPDVDWFALSPLIVLVSVGLFLLLVGRARRRAGRGAATPIVTAAAAGAAGVLSMVLWDDITDERPAHARRRRPRLRHVRHVRDDHHLRRRRAGVARDRRLPPPRGDGRSRGLRPLPRRRRRRHRDGRGQRPDRAVHRAGDDVAGLLRARRQLPPQGRQLGERAQVLRARRVLVGVLPLRHRPRLRRRRLDEHHDDGRHAHRDDPGRAQRRPRAGRRGAAARRARVQGRRRAVPRLDARRLPGRPDPRHRLHGVGGQGRRVRRHAPGLRRRPALLPRRLAAGDLAARRAHPDRRLVPGRRADRRQAHARLLVDQPRRLRARRCRGRRAPGRRGRRRPGRAERARVPAGVRGDGDRVVRRRRPRRPRVATTTPASTPSAASAGSARCWRWR